MDLESDEIEDNSKILESGILFYKTNIPVTEDFLEDAKAFILRFADTFNDLSEVNENIKDYRFRELMIESEEILGYLWNEINDSDTLNTRMFYEFCRKQKQCLSILEKIDPDIDNMMTKLSLKTES